MYYGHTKTLLVLLCTMITIEAFSQPSQRLQVTSPEITDEGLLFRVYAPNADTVLFTSPDIPGLGWQGVEMTSSDEGVWEIQQTVDPGTYRYRFSIDETFVIDPENTHISESNMNVWSLVHVPGARFMDTRQVPRGAVASVTYYSTTLERHRRMHVYTPPGYEKGGESYPVLYLLHGALDSDHSWSSVGRAGFILDNLIAAGEAKPMIVVMPHGHTGPFTFGMPLDMAPFVEDFNSDIRPYIENHYRTKSGREHRALAGLSMGGGHTLEIGIPDLGDYAYLGVFSSGLFGGPGGAPSGSVNPEWEEKHKDVLSDDSLKEGLELFWFATGTDDFLLNVSRGTVEFLRSYDFDVVYEETKGGHTWIVWRDYLHTFAPKLFQQ